MKKVFNSLFVIIAAMVTFAGCAKQETDAPATSETKTVQFFANSIETKTEFGTPDNGVYPTLWSEGDKVKILVNLEDVKNTEKTAEIECSEDFRSAKFTSELVQPDAETFTFYSVSPSVALLDKTAEKLYVTIPSDQTPLETSVDKKAQLLFAASETTTEMPSSVELAYHHLTAYGKFSLSNLDAESVSSIKLEADFDIAGKWDYFVEDGSFKVRSGNGSKSITLTTSSTTDIWFACAPVDVTGKTMTLTVTTEKGSNFVKVLNFPADKERKFEAGKISKFIVDMTGITAGGTEEPEQPGETTGGTDILTRETTGVSGTNYKDWTYESTTTSAKYAGNSAGGNESIQLRSNNNNSGIVTTASAGVVKKIIVAWNSNTNSERKLDVYGKSTAYATPSDLYSSTTSGTKIGTINNGTTELVIDGDYQYIGLRSQSGAMYLSEIQIVWENANEGGGETPEPEPKTLVSISVADDVKTEYTVGDEFVKPVVTATYDDESTATVTPTSVSEPDMNTVGTQDITVSYTEGEVTAETTYTITVNEAPAGPVVATIEEFLAAEDSETVWYQLTGTISNIVNTTYGNFDLTDETGTVYVYGLKKSEDAGNKTFSELGLKEGDTVTLIGNRDTYVNNGSEKDEVTNAYYVSHAYLRVSNEAISVASNATSAEFTVDANVEWTVSCLTATATKAGNKVTIAFKANETAEAVVYEVVVNSELGNKTVTITQAAAEQGGGDEPVVPSTYQYILKAKPSTGNVTLGGVTWSLSATNLNNYNSANYAGVQFGTSSKTGNIKLTSQDPFTYDGKSTVKEIRLWLNNGSGTITPTVTINGVKCTMTGTIKKNSSAGSDYTKASLVTFTPAQPTSGVIVIDLSCNKAGYFCAMEIDVQ